MFEELVWTDVTDLEACHDIVFQNVDIRTDDDEITVKAGAVRNSDFFLLSYNIDIRDSKLYNHKASALKTGSESIYT